MTIYTIGHSTRPIAEFVALLQQVDVELLVDVRSIPRSRMNPQFNADVLPAELAPAGIRYRQIAALGGRRGPLKGAPESRNTLWRVGAFRNYADYAGTDSFRAGLHELRDLAREYRCAIMCAEAVWWRCHRRIIADFLIAKGDSVIHIMGHDKLTAATLTPAAVVLDDGTVSYPPEQTSL